MPKPTTEQIVARYEKAKLLHKGYQEAYDKHYKSMSSYERAVHEVLSWITFNSDEAPEEFEY